MEFSDSEEVDSVYEEESDVSSDEGRGTAKGPVAQLLSLKGVSSYVYCINDRSFVSKHLCYHCSLSLFSCAVSPQGERQVPCEAGQPYKEHKEREEVK